MTPEQEKDIKERVEKASTYLKELELEVAVQTSEVNLGAIDPKFGNIFGNYLQPFLKDTKYSSKPSPFSDEVGK